MDGIYLDRGHISHTWFGPPSKARVYTSNDLLTGARKLYPVTKQLDAISENKQAELLKDAEKTDDKDDTPKREKKSEYDRGMLKISDDKNVYNGTIKAKYLGPQEMGEKCFACALNIHECQSHSGSINNTAHYVRIGLSDTILQMLKVICVNCNRLISSNKCFCGAEPPGVTRLHASSYLITISGDIKNIIQLDTVQKIVRHFIDKIGPIKLNQLMHHMNVNMSKNMPFSSLISNKVLVSGNQMRLDSYSPTKGQIVPLVDNKKLNAIVPTNLKRSRDEIVNSVSKITEYLAHSIVPDDEDDKTSFQSAQGKEGFLRKSLYSKLGFSTARVVGVSSNSLLDDEIGVNINTANAFKVGVRVTRQNLSYIKKLLKDNNIIRHALLLRNKRIYNIVNSEQHTEGKEGYEKFGSGTVKMIPRIGDLIHRPLIDGDIVVVSRHPIKGERSTVCCKVVVFRNKTSGVFMNYRTAQKLSGDFDGDEFTLMILKVYSESLSTFMTMGPANTIYSEKSPGIYLEISSDSIGGLMMLSTSEVSLSYFQFMDFFRQVRVPVFFDKKKKSFTCKDIITAVLLWTKLTYKVQIYKESSEEWKYWGKDNSVLHIKNGVFIGGVLIDWTVSSSNKSIFTKLAETIHRSKVLKLSNTFHMLGLTALRFFGNGQQLDNIVSKGEAYNLNKAACGIRQAKVEAMLDASMMPKTLFAESNTVVSMAKTTSMPQSDLVSGYFGNLVKTKDSSGRNYNEFMDSMMGGLGINSRHGTKIVGYGDIIVNGGLFTGSFLANYRKSMSLRIGELNAAITGMNISNMSIGTTPNEQLNGDFIAVIAFIIKIFQVATAGTNLNEGKAFLESELLTHLMEVTFNGYKVTRYFGTSGLIPGLCVYAKPKAILENELGPNDFLDSKKLYTIYKELVTLEKKVYEKESAYDIYDFSNKKLVFWDHNMILNYAESKAVEKREKGNPAMISEEDGDDVSRFYAEDADDKTIIECYEMFINSLYKMCGTPTPIAWRETMSFIVLYFMTVMSPVQMKARGLAVGKFYMDKVRNVYEEKSFAPGSTIGGDIIDSTLTHSVQSQLDAHKKPGVKLEKNLLKNMLNVDKPEEGAMYIFLKEGTSKAVAKKFADLIVETHVKDVIDSDNLIMKYNNSYNTDAYDIRVASEKYYKSNSIVDIDVYFECTFNFAKMAYSNVSIVGVIVAINAAEPEWQTLPLKGDKTQVKLMIVIDDLSKQKQMMERLLSIKISGIDGIRSTVVTSNETDTTYIVTKGINMNEVMAQPMVDANKTICDNIDIMQKLIGIHAAQVAISLVGRFVFRGSDLTLINGLIQSRCVTGKSVPANRHGVRRFMTESTYKQMAVQSPFTSMTKMALAEKIDRVDESLVSAMAVGGLSKSGTNYSKITVNMPLNKDRSITGKVIEEVNEADIGDYMTNLFDM